MSSVFTPGCCPLVLQSVEFWQMLVSVVKALLTMGSWEAIHGLADWCQMRTGTKPLWIQGAEAQAKGRYD